MIETFFVREVGRGRGVLLRRIQIKSRETVGPLVTTDHCDTPHSARNTQNQKEC